MTGQQHLIYVTPESAVRRYRFMNQYLWFFLVVGWWSIVFFLLSRIRPESSALDVLRGIAPFILLGLVLTGVGLSSIRSRPTVPLIIAREYFQPEVQPLRSMVNREPRRITFEQVVAIRFSWRGTVINFRLRDGRVFTYEETDKRGYQILLGVLADRFESLSISKFDRLSDAEEESGKVLDSVDEDTDSDEGPWQSVGLEVTRKG